MRILKTNPVLTILNSYLVDSPQPSTLSYLWNFGSLLGLSLVAQIITGILLAMHYAGTAELAFNSVEHIMRDVNEGWLLRMSHANMASFFFIAVYLHISRGLYYGSYRSPRIGVWVIGTIIFFLMMATKWPIWILINDIKSLYLYVNNNLSFNKARTKAINRIGPHNIDMLSVLICGMLNQIKKFSSFFNSKDSKSEVEEKFEKKRLKNFQRRRFSLTKDLQEILIGLLLGDVCAQKRSIKGNTNIHFEQSIIHKDYIFYLFELFKDYCRSKPKVSDRLPDKRTGKIYTRVQFTSYCLPCFNELYYMFYNKGKKIVPLNIEELLTPLGLAFWICDDGTFDKKHKYIRLATNAYTLQEVDLLLNVLKTKFKLNCYYIKDGSGYVITINAKSVLDLQVILNPIMPIMMKHKIGIKIENNRK